MKMKTDTKFYGLVGLFFIVLIISPNYNSAFLNENLRIDKGIPIEDIKSYVEESEILFAKEGLYGSVDVIVSPFNTKLLKINGKIQCGTHELDRMTTTLLGGLPTAFNKKGDALNIGLGCGLTLGMLEKGNFEIIDTLEIDSLVVEASKYFNDIHNNALDDPRSNIIIDDARNYLLKTNKKYDVIVNEPSHPHTLENSNLMTKEFFELMKEHLKEDGIVVQWVPTAELKSCDKPAFTIFYKTFSSVFPYNYAFVSKAEGVMAEMIIVGSLTPQSFDDYEDYYEFNNEDVIIPEHVEISTDDKPIIEFIAARKYTYPKLDCVKEEIEFKNN